MTFAIEIVVALAAVAVIVATAPLAHGLAPMRVAVRVSARRR